MLLCALLLSLSAARSLSGDLLQIGINLLKTKTPENDAALAQTLSTINYTTIREFVGCESGISTGIDTVFTCIDIGQSDGWHWQTILFVVLYLYAWYQQNFSAVMYYCGNLLTDL